MFKQRTETFLFGSKAYQVYGKTLEKGLFATDDKPRYIHLYHSSGLEAHERADVEKKINQLTAFLKSHINQFREFGPGMETYFELVRIFCYRDLG